MQGSLGTRLGYDVSLCLTVSHDAFYSLKETKTENHSIMHMCVLFAESR